MITEVDLIQSSRDIDKILEKYAKNPLEELLILNHARWMVESSHLCKSMVDTYGLKAVE